MAERIVTRGAMRITGSGMAVPSCPSPDGPLAVVTREHLEAILVARARSDREAQAIRRIAANNVGERRHWSHWVPNGPNVKETTTADLAAEAGRKAIADAGVTVAEIDLVILALSTSTLPTIATATIVADALGYRGPSFDLKAGCAGTLYALHLASVMLGAGYRRILVIGADTFSKYVDVEALKGFINVGDGAGALVLERASEENFVSLLDGEYATWKANGVFGGLPYSEDYPEGAYYFRGASAALREPIVQHYQESLRTLLGHERLSVEDLAYWIPHQIAPGVLSEVREGLGLPETKMFQNSELYGNTGAASLPIALHEARGGLPDGWIALSALGGGMRWGAALWRNLA